MKQAKTKRSKIKQTQLVETPDIPVAEFLTLPELADIPSLVAPLRRLFSEYWTLLNEMHLRGEVPEWIKNNFPSAGRYSEAQTYSAAMSRLASAASGDRVAARYSLGQFLDSGAIDVHDHQRGEIVFHGTALELLTKHGDMVAQLTAGQLQMLACAFRDEVEAEEAQS